MNRDLVARINALEARIRCACEQAGRDPSEVELLPVSKRHPIESLREAMTLGYLGFGENYVQEAIGKATALPKASFTLIGPLQRNKARSALQTFHAIQTVDRPELALRLRHLAEELDVTCPIWIQVDLWEEDTKMGGCSKESLPLLLESLEGDRRLPLTGFMAIPPPGAVEAFRALAELRARWQDRLGLPLRLSMGMSDDLETAIAAGTDQVRVGTAFFGSR